MAVKDYKISTMYIRTDDGIVDVSEYGIIGAISHYRKKYLKNDVKASLFAVCEVKRRQSVDTYVAQLKRYLFANASDVYSALKVSATGSDFSSFEAACGFSWEVETDGDETFIKLI